MKEILTSARCISFSMLAIKATLKEILSWQMVPTTFLEAQDDLHEQL